MDYVGGDVAYSVIERDKLSLQEVKGFLADHLTVKESMKFYFLMPVRDLINGLLFPHDYVGCMSMSDHTTDGGVADIFVEYNGEHDEGEQESGSDFQDEIERLRLPKAGQLQLDLQNLQAGLSMQQLQAHNQPPLASDLQEQHQLEIHLLEEVHLLTEDQELLEGVHVLEEVDFLAEDQEMLEGVHLLEEVDLLAEDQQQDSWPISQLLGTTEVVYL
ncbi:hypothetical protein D1007_57334 [Hordeum vulgare]|nr:hypothetical protein D1007_57334 [Hordeum vulgare]